MKALILASGTGSRLSPLTDETTKNLVDIGGCSVLTVQLDMLKECGIKEVIITTGPFREKIEAVANNYSDCMNVTYVYNEKFDSTNYIYSMFKCKSLIDDDILYLHGDLVFDSPLLKRVIATPKSCIVMNSEIPLPEKDFKGRLVNNMIKEIGLDVFGEDAFFVAPLYKLEREDFLIWMEMISEFVEAGDVSCYAENALNKITDKIDLKPLYYSSEFCMELDTHEDLEKIKEYIKTKA